ncbi:MAG: bfrH [Collimonas fungivorans]|uniref:TonB-dependent siderophore receptor n=1 Tax=Collimonas fungivorans TaxID=158899 RepID=UPI0026ED4F34|nr:TonB-dependent receptor [Collimonas fungivorans]MDB5767110.1 bfrH [Collimonas fungivorans]
MHVACCFLVSAGSIAPQQAWAQAGQPAKDYSIAGGKLNQALAVFAVKAGISLAYDAALVQDKYSPGLAGRYPVAEALARLLNGTGLEAAAKAEGGYLLRAATPAPPAASATTAAAVAERARAREDTVLMAMTVTGTTEVPEPAQGFAAASSNSATRGDTPLSEIAQSVQVVTKDVMASQQAQSLLDALHDVSGVNIYNRGVDSAIYIRGFAAPSRINGLEQGPSPIDNASSPLHTPLAAIERIDVLKGADSIIANGQMQPGGLANIITKRPQAEAVRELTLEAGSYGHQRMTLDLAGALSEDQAWTHRLILSGNRDPNATGRYDSAREVYVAPSLGYSHGDTTAVVGLSYQRNQHASGGFGPLGAVDDGTRSTSVGASYDWQQKLGSGWSWQSKGNYMKTQVSFESYYCAQSKADGSGAAMRGCQPQAGEATSYGWNVENSVRGIFFTGPVKHVVLAGVAFHHSWRAAPQIEIGDSVMASLSADSLPEVSQSSLAPWPGSSSQSYNSSNWFLQDQLSWRSWHLLANLGYTKAWSHSIDAQTGDDTALHPRSKPVYNIGLAYQLTDSMMVYVNQQKSFVLQAQASGPGPNGGPAGIYNFPSTEGKSIEAGLKLNLFDERLLLTASVFRATHSKVLYGEVDDAGVTRLLGSLPPTVSYGTELDVAGSPVPGWNLIASYSYTGFKAGQPSDFSFAVDRVARHQASFWSSYDLQSPGWRGWGYGLGMSSRGGYRNINDAYMGGQFSTDANLRYKSRSWSLTLGMRNIFDRKLYGSFASIPEGSGFEQGRTIVLTGRYNF